jgi:S-adenosylmethionine:tRNA ribosyltransferase-isomerase
MTNFKTPIDVDTDLLEAYDYALDDALIAQAPVTPRDAARLMIDVPSQPPQHARFRDLGQHLRAGDLLVFNQTRVVPCRLYATKPTGGRVELFVLGVRLPGQPDETGWSAPLGDAGLLVCMTRASKPLRAGARLTLEGGREVELVSCQPGRAEVRVVGYTGSAAALLDEIGHMPLPPYILAARAASGHEASDRAEDREDYQTVYAREEAVGSVAAPTAGLHFTPELLDTLSAQGVELGFVTLLVGMGTFVPVSAPRLSEHPMHEELYMVDAAIGAQIAACRARAGRVIAVGTTTARVLESEARLPEPFLPGRRATRIFMRPGNPFVLCDGLITNLHLPCSTLLALVASLVGYARMRELYDEALRERYRFFSYGDAMLLWRAPAPPAHKTHTP